MKTNTITTKDGYTLEGNKEFNLICIRNKEGRLTGYFIIQDLIEAGLMNKEVQQ